MAEGLSERCRAMVLRMEWSLNLCDSQGGRCPQCRGLRSEGHSRDNQGCDLGRLCDDLRTVNLAARLERGA